jgi:hypothetical protein
LLCQLTGCGASFGCFGWDAVQGCSAVQTILQCETTETLNLKETISQALALHGFVIRNGEMHHFNTQARLSRMST